MPELPEVETIRRDLEYLLLHQTMTDLHLYDPRLLLKVDEKILRDKLVGQSCMSFNRHGKYFWITFSNQWKLLFHLRMTGQLTLTKPLERFKALRCSFQFREHQLNFIDQRRFGEIHLYSPEQAIFTDNHIGPDFLTVSVKQFGDLLKTKQSPIHSLLLNQQLVAGIGNIYSQESLFRARIRPKRLASRLKNKDYSTLHFKLTELLHQAIELRGSTSRNYRDAYGQMGNAQSLHKVYQKSNKPCVDCGHPLKGIKLQGRGVVFCSVCQS